MQGGYAGMYITVQACKSLYMQACTSLHCFVLNANAAKYANLTPEWPSLQAQSQRLLLPPIQDTHPALVWRMVLLSSGGLLSQLLSQHQGSRGKLLRACFNMEHFHIHGSSCTRADGIFSNFDFQDEDTWTVQAIGDNTTGAFVNCSFHSPACQQPAAAGLFGQVGGLFDSPRFNTTCGAQVVVSEESAEVYSSKPDLVITGLNGPFKGQPLAQADQSKFDFLSADDPAFLKLKQVRLPAWRS
jgi:hypothetical protein